jgi:hypothetical protein
LKFPKGARLSTNIEYRNPSKKAIEYFDLLESTRKDWKKYKQKYLDSEKDFDDGTKRSIQRGGK